jgi:hypothetical protein
MALKKSDKIIAIAGVLILIIAAISIVVLYSPEKEVEKTISEEKTFYVTWEERTGVTSISGHVSKKASYTDSITVTVLPTDLVDVLTNVKIQLVWEDKVTYRGIFSKGKDTLTAYIYPTGNEPGEPDKTVGEGNSSFDFSINSMPTLDQTTAIDIDEANGKIKGEFSGKDTASFDTEITIKYGEKLRRPLKFLKEKGDDFELTITYTYYYPVVTEETGDQAPPEEPSTPYLGMLVNTGSSIRW